MNRFESGETIEYKRIKYRRARPDKKILVFVIGGILGIIFFYMSGGGDIKLSEDFWKSSFSVNENTGLLPGLFQYIFALRIKQLIFLLICSFSYIGNIMAYGILGSLGFEFGIILFTFAYNYKWKGILLSMAMVLPQGIFYILMLLIIFEGCYNGENPSIYKEKVTFLWKIIMTVILFLLGFLCETCINFEIIQKLIMGIK
jgi:hypothetical protein